MSIRAVTTCLSYALSPAPPEVGPFSFAKSVALGQRALVSCTVVGGDGPFHIRWDQDGRDIGASPSKHAKTVTEHIATLTIDSVAAEDVGNYTCTVSNSAGESSFTAPLTVRDANETPVIMPYSFPKNVALGQKTIVTCVAQSGTGPLEFRWRHNGRPIADTTSRYEKKLSDRVSTMSIERLSAEDLGNYTCVVSNSAGSDTFTAPLVVEDQPHVQPFSFPQNVNLGEEASVTCVVTRGSRPFKIVWTQDGRLLLNDERKFAKTVLDNIVTLTIRRVAAEDVGNYSCAVANDFGSDTASATLIVEGPPEVQPFSFSKNVLLGKKAVVNCAVDGGEGPFKFEWTQNNRALSTSATKYVKEVTDTIVALILEKVAAEDVGNYTCIVSNKAGRDSYTAALVVRGRPEIMPFSFSKNVLLGQKTTVTCVVSSGTGPFRFEWKHGESRVASDSRKNVLTLAENVAALTIDAITAEDVGNYTCTVASDVGKASYSAVLAVEVRIRKRCVAVLTSSRTATFWLQNSDSQEHGEVPLDCLRRHATSLRRFARHRLFRRKRKRCPSHRALLFRPGQPNRAKNALDLRRRQRGGAAQNRVDARREDRGEHCQQVRDGGDQQRGYHDHREAVRSGRGQLHVHRHEPRGKRQLHGRTRGRSELRMTASFWTDKPRIQPLAFPEVVNLGEEVSVTCAAASGRKPFRFAWAKDGKPLVDSKTKYSRRVLDNVAVMTIESVSAQDVGNYTCTVSNHFGIDRATAALVVDGPPEVHPFFFSKNVALGGQAVVNCAVIGGEGPFAFRWLLNGEDLETSATKYVDAVNDKIATLTIEKVGAEDIGNYTCTVTNKAGSDSFTAPLVVKANVSRM
ncbi:hypothetical protein V5799_007340 [Amblyomma americanum]|uniref:Ig-like domain-containing protein n=1 Tax=Amblyomma americanum TaxID=6943 RepID=A0AAQ4DTU2_AMBAM